MTPLAKRLEDAILRFAREDQRSNRLGNRAWASDIAPLLAEVAALESERDALEYTANLRAGGCECSDEDMCRFARERDEARAALRELGHDWCREHCDGDDHTDECERAHEAYGKEKP